jgi:tetratricopeptide (TPR) repeat protein
MEASLDRFEQVKNPRSIAEEWIVIGVAAQAMGDMNRARQSIQNSLAYHHEHGDESALANGLLFINLLEIAEGNYEQAAETNEKAWQLAQKINNPTAAAKALYIRARLSRLSGYLDWAGKHAAEGQRISAQLISPEPKMLILLEQGYLAVEGGRLAEAGALWRQAIQSFNNSSQEAWMLFPLGSMAFLTALEGKMERAARLFGSRWSRGFLNFLSPIELARFEVSLATVKTSLGESQFNELYETSQSMTLEQALALALELEAKIS